MNSLYFLVIIFSLFLVPSVVYAQTEDSDTDKEKLYDELELEPLKDSPYTAEFVAVTKKIYFV